MDELTQFLAENKHIRYATPESSDYAEMKTIFAINETQNPAIVVRPHSAEDVAGLVSILTKTSLPFTVRSGGHDIFGRAQIENGITIDMRDISHINVEEESQTVRVGGGVITLDLMRELYKHSRVTPHGNTPSVGYVGWATHGGYGMLSAHYGLGADQIVGATVVDHRGSIREADSAMLTAIRGAGGALGVIVELKVKTYPLDEILAGMIIYDSNDLSSSIRQFNTHYEQARNRGIAPALGLYQAVVNLPPGKVFLAFLLWSSPDHEEGQKWVSKVCSWAPLMQNTVGPTNIADWADMLSKLVLPSAYATMFAPAFYKLTPEVLDVISEHAPLQPNNPEVLLACHDLRLEAPQGSAGSVFTNRFPHFVMEIIPITSSEDDFPSVKAWGQRFYDALMKTNPANIMPSTYLPLTPPERSNVKCIYGDRYELFRGLKEAYDPENKFSTALARV